MILTDATVAEAALTHEGVGFTVTEGQAIALDGDRIAWVGPAAEAPEGPRQSLGGRLVTAGLIDCHTHLVHGGDRAVEFDMRLNGAAYEEIARAGGGILSTVRATRGASDAALLDSALARADHLIAEGVTTIEVKSGYGLDVETELRMLRTARRIATERPVRIVTTWLAAHALPPEYKDDRAAYLREVAIDGLAAAHAEGLVDAVDGFCEGIAFSVAEMEQLFDAADRLGLPVKLHAEQLSDLGGAAMAARRGAISADHLEHLGADGIAAMADSGTVAVMLPGAYYTLRETQAPPIAALRAAGVPMALATDCNPGTSPLTSLLLTMNMGATLFRMTPAECLAGVTSHAARALGLDDRGRIAPGLRADLAVWNAAHPAELSYRIGYNPLHARIFGGDLA
ncbi:imidazolonepropionase [Paracoccus sanguinis]|uniref:Imidazolonepropionase n=1 Tax=Paracoccus sanguinis TaxID=1545044 RepID=A0A1H2R5Y2_9RHOB|nr:imidazolonepropionase [Paracoccus sanguinis]KGJ19148.1 imidazolonepropionase [Paracoccus sanguinis]SDW14540.1 imidazolonepropionase [Paracoccus sanguinis]